MTEKEIVKYKSYPGPSVFSAFKGLTKHGFLDYIDEAWKTYGDTFELNLGIRSLIFAIHPDAVQQINVTHGKKFDKVKSYNVVRKYLTGEGLVASTGDLWKRQRKLMAPFFTPKGVQEYAEIMIKDSLEIAERWEQFSSTGQEVDIEEEMMRVTASIILKSMFSSEMDEETLAMKDAVAIMIKYATSQEQGIHPPDWVPTKRNKTYFEAKNKVHHYIKKLIDHRKSISEDQWPNDLLSKLMKVKDEETGELMSENLLRDESITTFFAGHETTAKTMSATWYALATNEEATTKLHQELDRELGDKIPTLDDLHRLPYTLQVVKEVLRLYPAAPFYVRDAVEDDEYNGYQIKKGTAVMLSPYFTHRHPDFWENPNKFDPDRWTPEKEKERHPYAYHPFATGKRICIGNNFSLLESHILLAILAQKFNPKLKPNAKVTWEMHGTLGTKESIQMKIEKRQKN
ncbi:cytochrome P450 [Paracrocinitomix mangrovi]|uniref:cytochrome P450 n=1 Tax=Paracrocinitomix mangrovi TaxID=2862509 RepID=UPI001C8DE77B|nr:cytochrome P450 [Paracrocinitomix mangrovi]UKN00267.1 cytochrome P450 [Paracrocinitomix mangrovi]